jgi:serine/threonine-protein kinase 24/25/MST4
VHADENRSPTKRPSTAPEHTGKEALLGRRLYNKAIEPTLAELHAQTAGSDKRAALANLSDAFARLDAVDPEGAYHLLQNLVSAMGHDRKLGAAFLPASTPSSRAQTPTDGTPMGTVVIRTPAPEFKTPAPRLIDASPTKLVLSNANPHLKSHRRRQGTPDARDRDGSVFESGEIGGEKSGGIEAKYPGQPAAPGLEHCQHLSEVFYQRWANGLLHRWGGGAVASN